MKIKGIHLENFQAHGDLDLNFSPRITTIKGSTDRGKSAIIRALGWTCLNNLPGSEFVKEGEKAATVTVEIVDSAPAGKLADGEPLVSHSRHNITRKRSASGAVNTYHLGEKEFKAFGQGVPSDILELLRLSNLNFQLQHESPFWFSQTAGEVSRQLNAVIDLTVIDSSLAKVASLVRDKAHEEKLCKERVEKVNKDLEALEAQRPRIEEFKKLRYLKDLADDTQKNHDRLEALVRAVDTNRAEELRLRSEEAEAVLHEAKRLLIFEEEEDRLSRLILRAEDSKLAADPPPDFSQVEDAYTRWRVSEGNGLTLSRAIFETENAQEKETKAKANHFARMREYSKQTENQICPLCQNRINPTK